MMGGSKNEENASRTLNVTPGDTPMHPTPASPHARTWGEWLSIVIQSAWGTRPIKKNLKVLLAALNEKLAPHHVEVLSFGPEPRHPPEQIPMGVIIQVSYEPTPIPISTAPQTADQVM